MSLAADGKIQKVFYYYHYYFFFPCGMGATQRGGGEGKLWMCGFRFQGCAMSGKYLKYYFMNTKSYVLEAILVRPRTRIRNDYFWKLFSKLFHKTGEILRNFFFRLTQACTHKIFEHFYLFIYFSCQHKWVTCSWFSNKKKKKLTSLFVVSKLFVV